MLQEASRLPKAVDSSCHPGQLLVQGWQPWEGLVYIPLHCVYFLKAGATLFPRSVSRR